MHYTCYTIVSFPTCISVLLVGDVRNREYDEEETIFIYAFMTINSCDHLVKHCP